MIIRLVEVINRGLIIVVGGDRALHASVARFVCRDVANGTWTRVALEKDYHVDLRWFVAEHRSCNRRFKVTSLIVLFAYWCPDRKPARHPCAGSAATCGGGVPDSVEIEVTAPREVPA